MLTDYGKCVFTDKNGDLWVIQPKSYTRPTEREKKELFGLLFSGKYEMVVMAVPASLKDIGLT